LHLQTVAELRFSVPKAQAGYAALRERYGVNLYRKNQIAFLTANGGYSDIESTAGLFDELGDDWDINVWGSEADFSNIRNVVMADRNRKRGQSAPAATIQKNWRNHQDPARHSFFPLLNTASIVHFRLP
jgi:hypothetical protein